MKKATLFVGLIAALAAGQAANAKTLEEVLKEKGVITEEDYKEVAKSSPLKYKLGEGFNFSSADGRFSNSIGASYQVRYSFLDLDDVNDTAGKKAQDASKFELRRIKLLFNGSAYYPELTYKLSLNFANIANGTTSNGGLLEETWLNYRLRNDLQFRFGQDKVQFGRQFITSSSALQFVEQSQVSAAFAPGYDTGIAIHGKFGDGLLNYSIAGLGGVGQNTYRSTSDNAFAARIVVNPLGDVKYSEADLDATAKPLVSLGANFYRDTIFSGETNNLGFAKGSGWYGIGSPLLTASQKFASGEPLDFTTFGIDSAFKWRGLSVTGEYFSGDADGQKSKHRLHADGFYLQTGYFVIPQQVEVAYRYSWLDPNRNVSNDLWIENAVAASWYINKHNLKLQTDYTQIHRQPAIASTSGKSASDDNLLRFQAQIVF